jgi:hypothetical protein
VKPANYGMPNSGPMVGPDGYPVDAFARYLRGIEDVSRRVAAAVEPLPPSATLAHTITKLNELIAALKAAGLMRS